MKKKIIVLLAILSTLCTSFAFAANWRYMGITQNAKWYLYTDAVHKDSTSRTAVVITSRVSPDGSSCVYWMQFYKGDYYRVVQEADYDSNNQLIRKSELDPKAQFVPIRPDSLSAIISRTVEPY